jgi:formylglycine-generating enzyme required for sulfatase activity
MKPTRRVVCILLLCLLPAIRARALSPENKSAATGEKLDITPACAEAPVPESACSGVSANDEWTPLVRAFGDVEMVLVPAGCFQMGNPDGFRGERPVHEVCLEQPFWIDRTEVTVA